MTKIDPTPLIAEAQARETALRDELRTMKTAGIIEVAVRNPNVMEYMKHWEARAEAADDMRALLAEAMPFIEDCADDPAYKAVKVRDLLRRIRDAVLA